MTEPREELIWNFEHVFGSYVSMDETSSVLKYYAIGQWVPVEERLPEDGRVVITRWSNGFKSYYTHMRDRKWCVVSGDSDITHWLELDLPEVEG